MKQQTTTLVETTSKFRVREPINLSRTQSAGGAGDRGFYRRGDVYEKDSSDRLFSSLICDWSLGSHIRLVE